MKPILENLNAKLDEQKYLLRIMSMWNEVKSQGIDLDAVSALGFDPVLMTIVERRDARRKTGFGVIEKDSATAIHMVGLWSQWMASKWFKPRSSIMLNFKPGKRSG